MKTPKDTLAWQMSHMKWAAKHFRMTVCREARILLYCKLLKDHDWTSASIEGKKPTEKQIKGLASYMEYAKMYCKRCEKVSGL